MPNWDYSMIPAQQWTIQEWQGTYPRRDYLSLTRQGIQRCTDDDNPNYGGLSSSEPQAVHDFMENGPAPCLLRGSERLPHRIVADVRAYVEEHRRAAKHEDDGCQ
ncbi:MAG: hypothetical protein M3437_08960 [Chloroflexota bacterium]|nr:hypothetical protein [Chloroflexota bacterium]MDQ5865123.1 hypothetical protein [Chloroflexota bacterium]